MLVHSCSVASADGSREVQIVNGDGCVADGAIMSQLEYGKATLSAHSSTRAFGFADAEKMRFSCSIRLCIALDGGCKDITPPSCSRSNRGRRRRRGVGGGMGGVEEVSTELTVVEFFDDPERGHPSQIYQEALGLGDEGRRSELCVSVEGASSALGVGLLASFVWLAAAVALIRRLKK